MLLLEFIFALIASIIALIATVLIIKSSRDSPIVETKFLVIAIVSTFIAFLLVIPITVFSSVESGIDSFGLLMIKFANIPITSTLLSWKLVFFLPTFKLKYRSVFLLGLMIFIDTSHMYLTFFGDSYILKGEFLRSSPDFNINGIPNDIPINDILLILSMAILVYVAIKRSLEIKNLKKATNIFMFSPIFTILFGLLFLLTILSFSLSSFFPEIEIPFFFLLLPLSIVIILVTYAFLQGSYVLFTVPVTFHAILVTEQQSGLVIYSESPEKDSPGEDLLGGLFTALNLSLKETIRSKKELEEISFGDKVVHIVPGNKITSFLITSEKNLMTMMLSKYITKSFEKQFKKILFGEMIGLNTSEFVDFEIHVDKIRNHFAF
ncbi:MAG: hypothetical protein ACW981_17935 [Candidatus Hodarchaeales archaeon]